MVSVPSAQVMVTASKGIEAATPTAGRISAAASAWVSPDEVVESAAWRPVPPQRAGQAD
jgi:hypothetical protein